MSPRPVPLAIPFVAALLVIAATPVSAQSDAMAWRTDLAAAQSEAQQSGKLVLVHFWTESCGPCKRLDAHVFGQPQVAAAIATNYVPVKVNAQDQPEIAQAMGVTRVPTDVVVTPQGQVVKAFISPINPMEYVGYVSRLAAAYKSRPGGTFAAVAANAPDPIAARGDSAVPQTTADVANRYAALLNLPASQPQASNTAAGEQTPPPQVSMNRYAAAPAASQLPQDTATIDTRPPVTPIEPTVGDAAAAPAVEQVADANAVKLPPGSPPLGFDGFCPVTMKSEWRWVKGDTKWGAIFEGRTYLFVSQEAQQTFLANPAAFSPVLAGADPVAAIDERRSVEGVRRFAVEYKDRFYLFADESTLERFWSNPDGYAQGVQRVAAATRTGNTVVR